VRSTQLPFKLNILFKKKYSNLLGPKTQLYVQESKTKKRRFPREFFVSKTKFKAESYLRIYDTAFRSRNTISYFMADLLANW
jgi:hypothetical protein